MIYMYIHIGDGSEQWNQQKNNSQQERSKKYFIKYLLNFPSLRDFARGLQPKNYMMRSGNVFHAPQLLPSLLFSKGKTRATRQTKRNVTAVNWFYF